MLDLATGPERERAIVGPPPTPVRAILGVRGLHYRYPGAPEPVLHGLDFEIHEGEIFGFLGPNGSGKSTTQKLLTRILPGYQGRIEVFVMPPPWQLLLVWCPYYWIYLGLLRAYAGEGQLPALAASWPGYPEWAYPLAAAALCIAGIALLARMHRARAV
jgi:hypothetical protein